LVKRVREARHVPLSHDGSWLWLARNTVSLKDIEELLRHHNVPYQTKIGTSIKPLHVATIQIWEALRKGKEVSVQDALLCYDHIKVGEGLARDAKKKLNKLKDEMLTIELLTKDYGLQRQDIWHDALTNIKIEQREYYLSMMRRGVKLTEAPLHTISTIHGAKGAEADNVVLLSDMGKNTFDAYSKNPDDERRVFYVGVTRSKRNLFIVEPTGLRGFKFPHI
jgi:hypothetical protein